MSDPTNGAESAEAILNREINIQIGWSISRSWELYKSRFGLILLSTFLIVIVSGTINAIPYMGAIAGLCMNGVLFGGLYWFFLRSIRGENAVLDDAFAGFTRSLTQLILGGLLTGLLTFLGFCLGGVPFLLALIPAILQLARGGHPDTEAIFTALGVFALVGVLIGILLALLIHTLWMFTLPLIIDKNLGFWEAMELSRKVVQKDFRALGLVIVAGMVSVSGVLLCCVGVFFTMPIAFGAIAFAYEDIFG